MTPRTRILRSAPTALLVAGIALTGCAGTATSSSSASASSAQDDAGYPLTVGSCGQDFVYDRAPERVIVGNENSLRTLEALGVDDSVYGYVLSPDDGGVAPADIPAGLAEISATTIPAREPVIASGTDLFLSYNEAQLTTQGALSYDDLAGIGANAYVMGAYCAEDPDDASIETVYDDISQLGAIFGVSAKADQLNTELKDRVAAAKTTLTDPDVTIADLKVAGGKVYAVGGYPVSAIADALGVHNQFADLSSSYAELSTEEALSMTPDVVFVNYVGDEQAAIDQLAQALPTLTAVQEGRVYGLDESGPQGGGVGVIDALEQVARAIEDAGK